MHLGLLLLFVTGMKITMVRVTCQGKLPVMLLIARIRGNDGRAGNVRARRESLAITSYRAKLDSVMAHEHEHAPPRPPPAELDHIRQFVNTLDLESLEDEIAEPGTAAAWF